LSATWFWAFKVLIMEGNSPTPLGSALWAIDKRHATTPQVAVTMLERHAKDESRRQASYRPARWIVLMPLNADPSELNISCISEYHRGERIARGTMLRKKDALPGVVEFQLELW
jgi:hypothetical protein